MSKISQAKLINVIFFIFILTINNSYCEVESKTNLGKNIQPSNINSKFPDEKILIQTSNTNILKNNDSITNDNSKVFNIKHSNGLEKIDSAKISSSKVFLQTGLKVKQIQVENGNTTVDLPKIQEPEPSESTTKNQPAEKKPKEEKKVESTPENTKAEKTPVEKTPVEKTPVEKTGKTPAETTPVEKTEKTPAETTTNKSETPEQIEKSLISTQLHQKLEELDFNPQSKLFNFVNAEVEGYFKDPENFTGGCKAEIIKNLDHSITTPAIEFPPAVDSKDQLTQDTSPEAFKNYLDKCIDIYNKLDNNAEKIKKVMSDFSDKLDNEIKEFEKDFPPTIYDSLLDYFFSYNYFKRSVFKAMSGSGQDMDNEGSIAEEYEKTVFRNKRLDALLKMSYETMLYSDHEKNDKFYNNNTNKLKKKTPLEDMAVDEMLKNPEYKKWANSFLENHPEFDLDRDEITFRISILFPEITTEFKKNYTAQENKRKNFSYATYY